MNNQSFVIAGGGIVFGVLLAVAITNSMTSKKISRVVGEASETTAASVTEATDALSGRLDALEASVSETATAASAEMEERLAALEADFNSRVDALSEAAKAQAGDFEAMIADLSTAQSEGSAVSSTAQTNSQLETSSALGVGQTAVLADGALRVFVSMIDTDAGAARLSVNGELMSLGTNEMASITINGADCSVGVVGLDAEGATIGADCGGQSASATAPVPPAPADGFVPGTVASLADGALRVFVSGLAADGSATRVAINGIDTQTVAAGDTVEVTSGDQACSLTVTGVGNGMVGLEGSCS